MRIVIDYRPALRTRTGVGEYIHQITRRLVQSASGDDITLFTSSWKDRPPPEWSRELSGVRIADQRVPVRLLNFAWHRLEWPPVETMTGKSFDVAHSPHPLLLPARSAAQVITIHDLHFLTHPERTSHEIRRDYPALARSHAARADGIIVNSRFTAGEVQRTFDVAAEKITVCLGGAPDWALELNGGDPDGYLLFVGTLDARKNLGGLLDAYSRLITRRPDTPRLVLAGSATPESAPWLQRIATAPLAGHVEHLGYVTSDRRGSVFQGARLLVFPSFEEGFGIPALEAMAAGVPVVASNRGALPEVVGDGGLLIDPDDPDALAAAVERVCTDRVLWQNLRDRGRARARLFSWEQAARDVRQAYQRALTTHAHRH